MGIAHRLNSWVHELLTPVSVSEADIREELECHLELRTIKNIAAGMSPEEARHDAETRFGDFESSVRDSYRASLGLRIWLKCLQWVFFAVLIGAVAMLTTSMLHMQSRYELEIDNLRDRLASQEAAIPITNESESDLMRVQQWNFAVHGHELMVTSEEEFLDASSMTPKGAWCDWTSLDVNP